MDNRTVNATLQRCPRGGPGAYTDVVILRIDSQPFSITCMPEGIFRDFLLPPCGSGSELLYKICYSVQQSLRPMYNLHPDGLTWTNGCGSNTEYLLRRSVFEKIEIRLDIDMDPFQRNNVESIYVQDAARIIIRDWKSTSEFGYMYHTKPIGDSYHSLLYLEIKGRFGNATNSAGPVSSLHLAVETTGYDQIIGFYVASSLSALRDLIHLMFRCNAFMITQDTDTQWYFAVDQYEG